MTDQNAEQRARAREIYAQTVEKFGGVCSAGIAADIRNDVAGLDYPIIVVAMATYGDERAATARAEVVEILAAMLSAQIVDPYQGWSITTLNQAADQARAFLGMPSIRDLNPDIAKMQDAATANREAIRNLAPPSAEADFCGGA